MYISTCHVCYRTLCAYLYLYTQDAAGSPAGYTNRDVHQQ